MDECCSRKQSELEKLAKQQKSVLWVVLFINLLMFVVEGLYGWISHSTSLLADSMDMFGDAFVYGVSLSVIGRGTVWNARVSLLKGSVMALFAGGILLEAIHKFLIPVEPVAGTMGIVGGFALLANLCCAALLLRHRNDDINMQSSWLCSRNDVIVNVSVLLAAAAVAITNSKYPDLIVGIGITLLVLKSAVFVLRGSRSALNLDSTPQLDPK